MLPLPLIDAYHSGNLIIFIGAGLSIGAGLPSWSELIGPLAQATGAHWPNNQDDLTVQHLVAAAQIYEIKMGRQALIQHLRRNISHTAQPTQSHELLAELSCRTFFTTNYDRLIEVCLQNRHVAFNVIVDNSQLAFWSNSAIQVIKLCGDISRPDTIVITEQDFNNYRLTHSWLVNQLRVLATTNTILFIGYSLQDPFINEVWDNIGLTLGTLRRFGYAVLFDTSDLAQAKFQHRGINVINIETNNKTKPDALNEWLKSLLNS